MLWINSTDIYENFDAARSNLVVMRTRIDNFLNDTDRPPTPRGAESAMKLRVSVNNCLNELARHQEFVEGLAEDGDRE